MFKTLVKYLFFLFIFLGSVYNTIYAHASKANDTNFTIKEAKVSKLISFPLSPELKKGTLPVEKGFKFVVDEDEEEEQEESSKKYLETNKYFVEQFCAQHTVNFDLNSSTNLAYYKRLSDDSSKKIYLLLEVILI